MRRKHVPQRTCIACRQIQDKRDLQRVVRTPEGDLVIDERGKLNGRGAYLCKRRACWDRALQGDQLSKALKADLGEKERQLLRDHMDTLTE